MMFLFGGVGGLCGRGIGTDLGCYLIFFFRYKGHLVCPDDLPVKGAAGNSARRFFRVACVVDIRYLAIESAAGDGTERPTALVGHFAIEGTVCNNTAVHHRAGKLPAGDGIVIPYRAAEGAAADGPVILHGAIECSAGDLGRVVAAAAADRHGAAFHMCRAAAYRHFIPNGQIADAENAAALVSTVCPALDRAAIPYGCRTGEDSRAEIADTAAAGVLIIRGPRHAAGNGSGGHLKSAAFPHIDTAALLRRTAHDIAAPHEEGASGRHINTAAGVVAAAGDGAALYLYDIFFGGGFICQLPQGVALIELVNGIGFAVNQRQLAIFYDMDQVAAPADCFQQMAVQIDGHHSFHCPIGGDLNIPSQTDDCGIGIQSIRQFL